MAAKLVALSKSSGAQRRRRRPAIIIDDAEHEAGNHKRRWNVLLRRDVRSDESATTPRHGRALRRATLKATLQAVPREAVLFAHAIAAKRGIRSAPRR